MREKMEIRYACRDGVGPSSSSSPCPGAHAGSCSNRDRQKRERERERERVGTNKRRQFWSVHHGAMTAGAAAVAAAVLKKIALTRVAAGS
jgi:hypothetical protein